MAGTTFQREFNQNTSPDAIAAGIATPVGSAAVAANSYALPIGSNTPRAQSSRARDIPSLWDWISDTSHATIELGTNANDFSTQINQAISDMNASPGAYGSTLLVNRGKYVCGSSLILKDGVHLWYPAPNARSHSAGRPRIQATNGMTDPLITCSSSVVGAGLFGIYFIGGGAAVDQNCLDFATATSCAFENLRIDTFGGQACNIAAGVANRINNWYTPNCGGVTKLTLRGVLDLAGTEHWVQDCEISAGVGAVGSGSKLSASLFNAGVVCRGSAMWFDRVYSEFAEIGWVLTGTGQGKNRLRGCTSDNCVAHGLKVESSNSGNKISDHNVHRCGHDADATYDGYWIQSAQNKLSGCTVTGASDTNRLRYGFNDDNSGSSDINQNIYDDQCLSYEHRTSHYHNSVGGRRGGFRQPARSECNIAVVGAAQTIVVEAMEQVHLTAGAAASVSVISLGQRRQKVEFTFGDANLTFTHGTNIQTDTGADIVGATGKIVNGFTSDGTKWYLRAVTYS